MDWLLQAPEAVLGSPPMLDDYQVRFGGIQRLYGADGLERLRRAHVCIVGVGGVGSWTVEALARTGVGALTLIDMDEVCLSNVNRQLPALTEEVGKPKVRVLAERVRAINPACRVNALEEFFTGQSAERLLGEGFDYVVDAIDSLANKVLLLARCRAGGIRVVTMGGAGGRCSGTSIKMADLAFASHDQLLTAVRRKLRAEYGFPREASQAFDIPSVFSTEPPVFPAADTCESGVSGRELRMNCNTGYGSATFVTGTFGFLAAGHVVAELAAGPSRVPSPASSEELTSAGNLRRTS